MNKRELQQRISDALPALQRDSTRWSEAERSRREFVAYFSTERLRNLAVDDYVIGRGGENRSLCYRLELEMDDLGNIRGATAFKFGIYYGKTKSDPRMQYRFTSIWGNDRKTAFKNIRQAIVDLIANARARRFEEIDNSRLSPMFKGKLLHLYFPAQYAPVYSEEHLDHFLSELNIEGDFRSCPAKQRALMGFRNANPLLAKLSPPAFMQFLYYEVGSPPSNGVSGTPKAGREAFLSEAIEGAIELAELPKAGGKGTGKPQGGGKADFEAEHKRRKAVGDRGEKIVLELERRRLVSAKRTDLARKIRHVAEQQDGAGYDILSYELDGRERRIEVKATSRPDFSGGFYITANELAVCKASANYFVYFVFSAMSKSPGFFPMQNPKLPGKVFALTPLSYKVSMDK